MRKTRGGKGGAEDNTNNLPFVKFARAKKRLFPLKTAMELGGVANLGRKEVRGGCFACFACMGGTVKKGMSDICSMKNLRRERRRVEEEGEARHGPY